MDMYYAVRVVIYYLIISLIHPMNLDTLVCPDSSPYVESGFLSAAKTQEFIPANLPSIYNPPPLSPLPIKNSS
jgi:hypothetical protein